MVTDVFVNGGQDSFTHRFGHFLFDDITFDDFITIADRSCGPVFGRHRHFGRYSAETVAGGINRARSIRQSIATTPTHIHGRDLYGGDFRNLGRKLESVFYNPG